MTKEERRKAMPKCTEFLDAIMGEFGKPEEIVARENGHVVRWRN